MADSVGDLTGQQLGNYRLLRLLRRESMADVYLGEHIYLETQAAIKVLPGYLSQQARDAFLAETSRIARMKHPNILRILEFGEEGKTPFLATDYTPNGSLRQLHARGVLVPPDAIVSYVRQIAAVLQYIHDQGLVHGGVRPENMLLGPQHRILLSNFVPLIGAQDEASTRGALAGQEEMEYMAPEQILGRPEPASDQYALGIVVYEWLSGDTPFHGSVRAIREQKQSQTLVSLQTKVPAASAELTRVVMTALAKDPQQRFASVTAFAQALEQVLQPAQSLSEREGQIARAQEMLTAPLPPLVGTSTGRKVTRGIAIGLFLMALLLIGGVLIYGSRVFPRPTTTTITSAQATQTIVARGTQQAVATITSRSTQEIYAAATRGNPLINDPLTNKSGSAWKDVQGRASSCAFTDGAYHVQVSGASTYLDCLAQNKNFYNFAFEVEMKIVKGDWVGLVFRSVNSDNNQQKFYIFRITASNSPFFSFALYNGGTITDLQQTIADGDLKTFNLVTVIAYEHTFYFYLNKQFVMKAQDDTLTAGAAGMYVQNDKSTTSEAWFRNARVWQL